MPSTGCAGKIGGLPVFDAGVVGAEVGELEFDAGLVLEAGLLLHRFDGIDLQFGPADGQHDAGQAAAGADIHQPLDAAQMRQHRQRIEQVVGDDLGLRRGWR
jgi:hypothetical protein